MNEIGENWKGVTSFVDQQCASFCEKYGDHTDLEEESKSEPEQSIEIVRKKKCSKVNPKMR